jgi:hypothetical protein
LYGVNIKRVKLYLLIFEGHEIVNNLSFIVTCGQIIPPGFNLRRVSVFVIGNYGMRGQAADLISTACFGVHNIFI